MRRVLKFLIVLVSLLLTVTTFAQQSKLPTFEDYRVTHKFNGTPAAAVITARRARMFRTMIRTQAKEGPNFAGHYTVAVWGCGSGCRQFAIVDAVTGKVYFHPDAVTVLSPPYVDEDNLQFRVDSGLLVIAGAFEDAKGNPTEGKFFYEWRNNRFKLIRKTKMELPRE